ncbi:unnamed protein product [Trichobilharzia szidati]|nr:unnamed protein product [Trichobilharzia szidati]
MSKTYFQIFFNLSFLSFLILCSSIHEMGIIQNEDELKFTILEELPIGTVIASGTKLGNLFLSLSNNNNIGKGQNFTQKPRILNIKDPGVRCFDFKWLTLDKQTDLGVNELQFIVSDRIDRETICPLKSHEMNINQHQLNSLNLNNQQNEYALDSNYMNSLNFNHDCTVTLRIATITDNTQKIYQIHVIIEDINDNPPQWNIDKITVYFRDDDPPGTKQSIPLAKDMDIGINAKINYQLLNSDSNTMSNSNNNNNNNNMHSYILNDVNNLKLRATDMFELVTEKVDMNHFGDERLFLTARHTLDREAKPQGWDLIILAVNNEGSIPLSSRLYIHVNITDVNDNSPKFTQSLYKPQLPNHKVGSIPENFPVGKTILRVHATDADEGKNAEITYSFAPDSTNQLIRHFFEMTRDGELRVLRPLNVDIKSQQPVNTPYLPTTVMSFDVIAVDGAGIAYAKTGHTTIQIEVENIDDEAPEIRIHPIQSLQDTSASSSNNPQSHDTEIAVLENQPAGQLVALIEVKDPDVIISQSISQCQLTGPNAVNFRLSYQDSATNEYRLYTATKLDREKQSRIMLSVECKDLTDHITSSNIIIHVLDANDHAPQCIEQMYRFALYEDDGEQDHLDITMTNRSWFTPNGLAFISVKDEDIGVNAEITYQLSAESEDKLKGRFSIDSKTGQLFAWGPFDREQISVHEFTVIAKDGGKPTKLSTSCPVTVKILDINDNPPMFHPQLGITGGYLFSIRENQLPGTRVGQIEAYDLDILPASTDISDLFIYMDKPNSLLNSNSQSLKNEFKLTANNIDKRLTYSLKNERNSQAFRIDPKTGVIITRTILDREYQSTYTFYAYVHDGPDHSSQTTNTTDEKTRSQSSDVNSKYYNHQNINEYRSHTASVMVTITVQDENDNDPVFVRPNATNHMILLNPTAIPGQSLSQLSAIDPDEGLNGQVTYAIKGETAGTLFNVDPRTGLLYLESQIPRQYITNGRHEVNSNNNNNNNNDNQISNLAQISTYPTFLLSLDACDQGEPRRCTHFPNLQIQIRSSSNIIDESQSSAYGLFESSSNQLQDSSIISRQGSLSASASASFFPLNPGVSNSYLGRYTLAEILIIGFSVFFSILILIILLAVFIIRRRTQQLLQNNERMNPELFKLNHENTGANAELNGKSKQMTPRSKKFCNWNTRKQKLSPKKSFNNANFKQATFQQLDSMLKNSNSNNNNNNNNSNIMLPVNCNLPINPHQLSSTSSPSSQMMINQPGLNYHIDVSNSCFYDPSTHHAIHYSPYSPIFVNTTNAVPVVSDDYQSLDCWNDITTGYTSKFKPCNILNPTEFNLPQQFYMRQIKQPTITTSSNHNNSNFDLINNLTHCKQKEIIDPDWKFNDMKMNVSHNSQQNASLLSDISSSSNPLTCTASMNISSSIATGQAKTISNSNNNNKESIQAYDGFLKSSFV